MTPADLEVALANQEQTGRKLGQIVVESGFVTVEELTTVLLEQCGIDMSTQDGFGSGLRDELARRGGRRASEPVRFAFNLEPEPEKPAKGRKAQRPQKTSRRVRLGRNPNRKSLKRLEQLVLDFERQEHELVETITSIRQLLTPVAD